MGSGLRSGILGCSGNSLGCSGRSACKKGRVAQQNQCPLTPKQSMQLEAKNCNVPGLLCNLMLMGNAKRKGQWAPRASLEEKCLKISFVGRGRS